MNSETDVRHIFLPHFYYNFWFFFLLLFISRSQGVFFLNTNKDPPYAKGILPEFTLSDNGTESTTEPMTTENAAADV